MIKNSTMRARTVMNIILTQTTFLFLFFLLNVKIFRKCFRSSCIELRNLILKMRAMKYQKHASTYTENTQSITEKYKIKTWFGQIYNSYNLIHDKHVILLTDSKYSSGSLSRIHQTEKTQSSFSAFCT